VASGPVIDELAIANSRSGIGLVGLCIMLAWGAVLAGCSSSSPPEGASAAGASGSGVGTGGDAGSAGSPTVPTTAGHGGMANNQADGGKSSRAGSAATASDAGAGGETPGVPDIATIMAAYHSYAPQTERPEPVSSYIFGLCRLPTLPERAFADSEHGDERYLRDWANELAVDGIARRGAPPFAPGAIIVKEKHVPGASSGEFKLAALGFMIKREAGFAVEHQDWDYAYWEPELGVIATSEQSAYCAGCHAGAAETDSVFVDGLVPGEGTGQWP
jgi:hypothetical protein